MSSKDRKEAGRLKIIGNEDPFILVHDEIDNINYAVSKRMIDEMMIYNNGGGYIGLNPSSKGVSRSEQLMIKINFDIAFTSTYYFEELMTDGRYITE